MKSIVKKSYEKPVRYILGAILIILAANAFGGGYYGMAGAKDVPVELLEGSPFTDYFIPGLFLFTVIGGSALAAALAVFFKYRHAGKMAYFCGTVTILWIAVQVSIIGYVSWMQPVTATAAVMILFLSWLLFSKNKRLFSRTT